jgi:hypothetical protein
MITELIISVVADYNTYSSKTICFISELVGVSNEIGGTWIWIWM